MSSQRPCWRRRGTLIAGSLLLLGAGLFGIRHWQSPNDPTLPVEAVGNDSYPGLDLSDPTASYALLRYVAETGGGDTTRDLAIQWLDAQARGNQPLSPDQQSWLLDTLTKGGHAAWDKEYKFWIYNSAFNALHHSPDPEPLTELLVRLAEHDPERTMRLYALQHIEVQRGAGRLTGVLAGETHALLKQLLVSDPGTGGTVIKILAAWEAEKGTVDPAICEKATELAADSSNPIDVRITALHTAGAAALDLSRSLSRDVSQPVLLRKASIALIGLHGSKSDVANLKKLSSESSRLARAADPATKAIRRRLARHESPKPISF